MYTLHGKGGVHWQIVRKGKGPCLFVTGSYGLCIFFLNRSYRFFRCLYVAWHRFVGKYGAKKPLASPFVPHVHLHKGASWYHLHFAGTPIMLVPWQESSRQRLLSFFMSKASFGGGASNQSCHCPIGVQGDAWCWQAKQGVSLPSVQWLIKVAPAHACTLTEYLFQILNLYFVYHAGCKYCPLLKDTLIKSHEKRRTAQIRCGNSWAMDIFKLWEKLLVNKSHLKGSDGLLCSD